MTLKGSLNVFFFSFINNAFVSFVLNVQLIESKTHFLLQCCTIILTCFHCLIFSVTFGFESLASPTVMMLPSMDSPEQKSMKLNVLRTPQMMNLPLMGTHMKLPVN